MDALEMIGRRLARTRRAHNLRHQIDALKEDIQRVEGLFSSGTHVPERRGRNGREDVNPYDRSIPAPGRTTRPETGDRHNPWSDWEHLDA